MSSISLLAIFVVLHSGFGLKGGWRYLCVDKNMVGMFASEEDTSGCDFDQVMHFVLTFTQLAIWL